MEVKVDTKKMIAWIAAFLMAIIATPELLLLKSSCKRQLLVWQLQTQPKSWTSTDAAVRVGLSGGVLWVPANQYGITAVDETGKNMILSSGMKIVEGINLKSHQKCFWVEDEGLVKRIAFLDR